MPLIVRLEEKCREVGVPCLSILGPVLQLLRSYLGTETSHRVGAQHTLNAEYFKRIDALNYTMLHDDGQHTDDLEQADVVLALFLLLLPLVPFVVWRWLKRARPGCAARCTGTGTPTARCSWSTGRSPTARRPCTTRRPTTTS